MSASVDEIRDRVLSLFETGGRYQVEKLMTIGVYLALCIATFVWVVTAEDASNELGAAHGFETLDPLDKKIFFLENDSGDPWTNVRIVLNDDYLYTTEKVDGGQRLMLRPEDFRYFWWIPRPWGRNAWEAIGNEKKPDRLAPEGIDWRSIEVRAREGRLDLNLQGK